MFYFLIQMYFLMELFEITNVQQRIEYLTKLYTIYNLCFFLNV